MLLAVIDWISFTDWSSQKSHPIVMIAVFVKAAGPARDRLSPQPHFVPLVQKFSISCLSASYVELEIRTFEPTPVKNNVTAYLPKEDVKKKQE